MIFPHASSLVCPPASLFSLFASMLSYVALHPPFHLLHQFFTALSNYTCELWLSLFSHFPLTWTHIYLSHISPGCLLSKRQRWNSERWVEDMFLSKREWRYILFQDYEVKRLIIFSEINTFDFYCTVLLHTALLDSWNQQLLNNYTHTIHVAHEEKTSYRPENITKNRGSK